MKAIVNGKIILKDRIVEDAVLLYSGVIEGRGETVQGENPVDVAGLPADLLCQVGHVFRLAVDQHVHPLPGVVDRPEERRLFQLFRAGGRDHHPAMPVDPL